MINTNKISVIIPCKNEQASILKTIKAIPDYVDEILVVDNGSTDKTVTLASKTRAKVLVENKKMNGIGYGYALLKGFKEATGDYIVTIDADGSHPAKKISQILKFMQKGDIDVVSCTRLPKSSDKAISKFRKFGIYVLNIETFLLFGIKISDMLTGMFVIKSIALPKLQLKMGDWNLSPEIKISAATNKTLKFAEYPITQIPRTGGVSKQVVWDTGKTHVLYIFNRKVAAITAALKAVKLSAFAKVRNISVLFYSK